MNEQRLSTKYLTDDTRWEATQSRDRSADGHFVYGVRTTGVYCHPSSTARLPNRENVEFFESVRAAENAGYRASRRARADRTSAAVDRANLIAKACRLIEASTTPPTLDELATAVGLSAFHFHRMFKKETGLTPKSYAAAHRGHRLREELNKTSVTDAIYGAGFNSNSRFYENSDQLLGMRPRDYQAGGKGVAIRFAVGQCSMGAILIARSSKGICSILLGDDPENLVHDLQDRFPNAQLIGGDSEFEAEIAQVVGFIEAPSIGLNLPLDVRGTAFQERVWQALREIPSGGTSSYSDIAERIGAPRSVRAVAQACGANPIAVAIPCHRVVRRDGDISGYRWGVDRKRELLRRESLARAESAAQPAAPRLPGEQRHADFSTQPY
jgi:AraC family transcriptional regulator of adaptative response/methylated-DNA-[protein]-cysteine methyltransferase